MANKIKAVLIDLSGTLHIDNTVIPGAIEALKKYVTAYFCVDTIVRHFLYLFARDYLNKHMCALDSVIFQITKHQCNNKICNKYHKRIKIISPQSINSIGI